MAAMRFLRKISDRGVLTIPAEIREALDVQEGDIVEFEFVRIVKKSKATRSVTEPTSTGVLQ